MIEHRGETIQRILGEIGRGVDRGDWIAALIRIEDARRSGAITRRDAERLVAFLDSLGDSLEPRARTA